MKIFFKAQLSSLLATAVDFTVTIFGHNILQLYYMFAVFNGAIAGALTNFFLNRHWSFSAEKENVAQQGAKYVLVWFGSLLLNLGGVYLLTEFGGVKYIISKILIAVLVGISFNYLLQKKYVFNTNETARY